MSEIGSSSLRIALRDRFSHFYYNKYILPFTGAKRYHISYSFRYKALWYRVYKVGTRSIDRHFQEESSTGEYIYASAMPYDPARYADWFRFAFVRHPVDRLISAWRNKVVQSNYFGFPGEQLAYLRQLPHFVSWLETVDRDVCDEHLQAQHRSIDMDHVQFIGRFEQFDQDLHHVAERLGLPLTGIHHQNRSGDANNTIALPLAERIAAIYAQDMELFYPRSGPLP